MNKSIKGDPAHSQQDNTSHIEYFINQVFQGIRNENTHMNTGQ